MHSAQIQKVECALYVVATPIGNLRDISLRALDVLSVADTVIAEDTRNTGYLLAQHNINVNRLLSLHQHNERSSIDKIISLLQQGQVVALVSDAGTPGISDPGAILIEAVNEVGLRVVPVPGANAAITALSASGLTSAHFLFYGFLPSRSAARCKALQTLLEHPYTLAFYEAPHRILETVEDMQKIFGGGREIVFARELTKMFENIHRCKLSDALPWLNSDSNNCRGEFVILIGPPGDASGELSSDTENMLLLLLDELPLKRAVQLAAKISGANKNQLYRRALEIKNVSDADEAAL